VIAGAARGRPIGPAQILATADELRVTAPRLDPPPAPIADRILRHLTRAISSR